MSKRVPLHATIRENGCWEVDSHTAKHGGYPTIWRSGQKVRTHVFVYSLVNGEIEKGKVIRHICNNPTCINPDHLVQGTHAENVNDKCLAGNQPMGINHGRHKLTEAQVLEIRKDGYTPSRKLCVPYGITESAIRSIRSGKGWKHLLQNNTEKRGCKLV